MLGSQWIRTETNNHTVVEGSVGLQVYIHFIQKVKMKIRATSLHLLKLLLEKLNRILVMYSGVKEDGHSPGAVIVWGGK